MNWATAGPLAAASPSPASSAATGTFIPLMRLALPVAGIAGAENWPQWRGPARDGVWREDGILERFPPEGPPVRWRTPIGPGFAGPAVAGARVFLMDRAVDEEEVQAIRQTLQETPGVSGVHDVRTRKMGDMVVVDAHIEVNAQLTVEQGHDIAVLARERVMQRHRVLNLMTHVDPWHRPDRDHAVPPHL